MLHPHTTVTLAARALRSLTVSRPLLSVPRSHCAARVPCLGLRHEGRRSQRSFFGFGVHGKFDRGVSMTISLTDDSAVLPRRLGGSRLGCDALARQRSRHQTRRMINSCDSAPRRGCCFVYTRRTIIVIRAATNDETAAHTREPPPPKMMDQEPMFANREPCAGASRAGPCAALLVVPRRLR